MDDEKSEGITKEAGEILLSSLITLSQIRGWTPGDLIHFFCGALYSLTSSCGFSKSEFTELLDEMKKFYDEDFPSSNAENTETHDN